MAPSKKNEFRCKRYDFLGVCLKMGFCIKEKVLGLERGKGPQGTGTHSERWGIFIIINFSILHILNFFIWAGFKTKS